MESTDNSGLTTTSIEVSPERPYAELVLKDGCRTGAASRVVRRLSGIESTKLARASKRLARLGREDRKRGTRSGSDVWL